MNSHGNKSMFDLRNSGKEKILSKLEEQFKNRFESGTAEEIFDFVKRYFKVSSGSELANIKIENLYGATLSSWQFFQQISPGKSKVRVVNPDLEGHGWHSNHTVIEILNLDIPFLVDSVRMEINRQGKSIHSIRNAILNTVRNEQGDLLKIVDQADSDTNGQRESIIFLEVDRCKDIDELKSIESLLLEVLTDVRLAVDDYSSIKDRVVNCIEELEGSSFSVASDTDRNEAKQFLEWLLDDNFTFLAYDQVSLCIGDSTDKLLFSDEEALGTSRRFGAPQKCDRSYELRENEVQVIKEVKLVSFSKDSERSRVHRLAYRDVVAVKCFDTDGDITGEHRFYGLYTSSVYDCLPLSIPLIRNKVTEVLEKSHLEPGGHSYKELLQVIKDLPREELFLSSSEELFSITLGIFDLQEKRTIGLFVRPDSCAQFYSCLYYAPRDIYSTNLRRRVQNILEEYFQTVETDFHTRFSESVLARTHFVLRVNPDQQVEIKLDDLRNEISDISRDWDEELLGALIEHFGEEQGNRYNDFYRGSFPSAYCEHFTPASAVFDVQRMKEIDSGKRLSMSFYRLIEESNNLLRFKLLTERTPLVLSDIIPILENLGMRVMGEHPYEVRRRDGRSYWLHDFKLCYYSGEPVELQNVKQLFQDAFEAIWDGRSENDEFNRLVIAGNLSWTEVSILRAYTRYNRQLRFDFSYPYIADTLSRHIQITKLLVALFKARFDPSRQSSDKINALANRLEKSIADVLDCVDNLNDDRILRRFLELVKATVRTNYFQTNVDGQPKNYLSFKISSQEISNIPKPLPMFETFVYSSRMEGVHLRGGKIARGGLRWSDRIEDYRTEVLGLVKAQQVKNSVIVPVGAKGCFVSKSLPKNSSPEEIQKEGISSYQTFICGILDLADNLVGGQVVPPKDVVRLDDDDPYIVVAADKGTATFSDIANEIAEEYGYWLGDAFASGGSNGYDHKVMGITAKGAWESVKRHFRELGLDTQSENFTVIGIGDMAGDVFGNGLLLSEHSQLVAAFNHMHIFVDPNPNPDTDASYLERSRLFALPRTTWENYDESVISNGGGVFLRSAKSIPISQEMKSRFDIKDDALSPNELITALLKAQVDLIWNGGIGTYIKGESESHAEVGDKANDTLRINGKELRCRVLGEGGNLGATQLGRIEYSLNGGSCNTDFIDNAGGVDCSDHEVNIKILLNELVANGDMTTKQRNLLLKEMTDEVSELVLDNNYHQVQALSIARRLAQNVPDEYNRLISYLEEEGKLDRALEFMPDEESLQERKSRSLGLTLPELSVLISYVKAHLKYNLNCPEIYNDGYLGAEVERAFPICLAHSFPNAVASHQLRTHILATVLANSMVNRMGSSFPVVVHQATGVEYHDITKTYVVAREIFGMDEAWSQIESLDGKVTTEIQDLMMTELIRLVRRTVFWLVRHHPQPLDINVCIERYRPGVELQVECMSELIQGEQLNLWKERRDSLENAGVPSDLAERIASTDSLFTSLGIIEVGDQTDKPLDQVARVYFALGEHLKLNWFGQQVRNFHAQNHWQSLACDSYLDQLSTLQRKLTVCALDYLSPTWDGVETVNEWLMQQPQTFKRWSKMLEEINSSECDCSIFSVALSKLQELARV